MRPNLILSAITLLLLSACGDSAPVSSLVPGSGPVPGSGTTPGQTPVLIGSKGVGASDKSCDLAAFPSAEWTQCEVDNFARQSVGPEESIQPAFVQRMTAQQLANSQSWLAGPRRSRPQLA